MDIMRFKMKDGNVITVDFSDLTTLTSLKHEYKNEIKEQLDEMLKIACGHLDGKSVYNLMKYGSIKG